MKILKLKFKNLNSLYGTWEIDFTDRKYDQYGIFSIIGPTGSGKTTILDAICLALYGKTPRLKSVNKSSNEIMSQQKGECFAELEFSVDGKEYICRWEQCRAYNKPSGNLQAQTHIIYDDKRTELCRKDIGKDDGYVSKLINMSFEQFTQCILLAQGSFAKFLNAEAKEKAEIFEKITGTEKYRKISAAVFKRRKLEEDKLLTINAQKDSFNILSVEDEAERKRKLGQIEEDIKDCKAKQEDCKNNQELVKAKGKAEEDYDLAKEARRAAETKWDKFASKAEALENAEKAARIAPSHKTLQDCLGKVGQCRSALLQQNNDLPGLEQQCAYIDEQIKRAEKAKTQSEAEFNRLSGLLREAEKLEAVRSEWEKLLTDNQTERNKVGDNLTGVENELTKVAAALKEFNESLQKLNDKHRVLSGYEGVREKLSGWEVTLKNLKGDIDTLRADRKLAADKTNKLEEDDLQKLEAIKAEQLQKVEAKQAEITEAENELKVLLEGGDKEKVELEIKALRAEVENIKLRATLEEHRSRLQDGCACPLCGSLVHPYAEGQIPVPTDEEERLSALNDKLENINKIEKRISEQWKELQVLKEQVTASERAIELKAAAIEHGNKELDGLKKKIADNSGETADKLRSLKAEFGAFIQISVLIDDNNIESVFEELEAAYDNISGKSDAYNSNKEETVKLNSQISEKERDAEIYNAKKCDYSQRIGELDEVIQKLRKDIEAQNEHILALTGGVAIAEVCENCISEHKRIEDIKLSCDGPDGLRTQLEKAKEDATTCRAEIQSLIKLEEQLNRDLSAAQDSWKRKLEESDFADENAFIAAIKDDVEIKALKAEQNELRDKLNKAKGAESKSKQLSEDAAKAAEGLQAEEITKELDGIIKKLDELEKERLDLQIELDRNEANKKQFGDKEEEYQAQKKVFDVWVKLEDLIGSANGDKYPKFVQNLTLRVLLEKANAALKKMSDRFILLPGSGDDLEFKVSDSYQSSAERSVKSLSGGETFIVSLALALGLSQMAGRNARIESFFLDEGFGTLDEETLSIVMEALTHLRNEGKTIGIISHVDALKELPVRIEVTPQGATGRSRIEGPGCRCLKESGPEDKGAGKKSRRRS